MPPPQKGTQVGIEAIVRIFEKDLRQLIRRFLTNDSVTGLLKIHEKTGILSADLYNKLRDYENMEQKLDMVIQKTREASAEQVVALLDLIDKELPGSKFAIKHFRDVLKKRPKVPITRPQTGGNLNVMANEARKQAETTVVLAHMLRSVMAWDAAINEENANSAAVTQSQVERKEREEKAQKEVAEARAELEAKDIQIAYYKNLLQTALETAQTQKRSNDGLIEQLATAKAEASSTTEQAARLQEENAKLKQELADKTLELEETSRQLQVALGKVDALENKVQDLEKNKEITDGNVKNLTSVVQNLALRVDKSEQQNARLLHRKEYNPRAHDLDYFNRSQPAPPRKDFDDDDAPTGVNRQL